MSVEYTFVYSSFKKEFCSASKTIPASNRYI